MDIEKQSLVHSVVTLLDYLSKGLAVSPTNYPLDFRHNLLLPLLETIKGRGSLFLLAKGVFLIFWVTMGRD